MHEALLYSTLEDGKVQCTLCPRRCIIANTKLGFCGVRRNLNECAEKGVVCLTSESLVWVKISRQPNTNFDPSPDSHW